MLDLKDVNLRRLAEIRHFRRAADLSVRAVQFDRHVRHDTGIGDLHGDEPGRSRRNRRAARGNSASFVPVFRKDLGGNQLHLVGHVAHDHLDDPGAGKIPRPAALRAKFDARPAVGTVARHLKPPFGVFADGRARPRPWGGFGEEGGRRANGGSRLRKTLVLLGRFFDSKALIRLIITRAEFALGYGIEVDAVGQMAREIGGRHERGIWNATNGFGQQRVDDRTLTTGKRPDFSDKEGRIGCAEFAAKSLGDSNEPPHIPFATKTSHQRRVGLALVPENRGQVTSAFFREKPAPDGSPEVRSRWAVADHVWRPCGYRRTANCARDDTRDLARMIGAPSPEKLITRADTCEWPVEMKRNGCRHPASGAIEFDAVADGFAARFRRDNAASGHVALAGEEEKRDPFGLRFERALRRLSRLRGVGPRHPWRDGGQFFGNRRVWRENDGLVQTSAPTEDPPRFVALVFGAVHLDPDASVGQKVKRLVERKAIVEPEPCAEFKPSGEGARADGGEDFRAVAAWSTNAILRLTRGAAVAGIPAPRSPNGEREGIFTTFRNGAIPFIGLFRGNGKKVGRISIDTDIRIEGVKTAWNDGVGELDAADGAFRTAGNVGGTKNLAGDS